MIRVLHPDQIADPSRGNFLVNMERAQNDWYHDKPVFVSLKGTPNEFQFVVVPR